MKTPLLLCAIIATLLISCDDTDASRPEPGPPSAIVPAAPVPGVNHVPGSDLAPSDISKLDALSALRFVQTNQILPSVVWSKDLVRQIIANTFVQYNNGVPEVTAAIFLLHSAGFHAPGQKLNIDELKLNPVLMFHFMQMTNFAISENQACDYLSSIVANVCGIFWPKPKRQILDYVDVDDAIAVSKVACLLGFESRIIVNVIDRYLYIRGYTEQKELVLYAHKYPEYMWAILGLFRQMSRYQRDSEVLCLHPSAVLRYMVKTDEVEYEAKSFKLAMDSACESQHANDVPFIRKLSKRPGVKEVVKRLLSISKERLEQLGCFFGDAAKEIRIFISSRENYKDVRKNEREELEGWLTGCRIKYSKIIEYSRKK